MAQRPFYISLGWTLRDYAVRVWDNSGEDNALFLAGGIAFNLLLAALPFVLLLASGLTYILPIFVRDRHLNSIDELRVYIHNLLPAHDDGSTSPVDKLIFDLIRTRGTVSVFSAIGFVWFSTRLFGSLRTVLASVFDIETERSIIAGKIFDAKITVVSMLLFAASVTVNAYLTIVTKTGAKALGIDVKSAESWLGHALSFAFILLMFFALYKYLPIRRIRAATAWVAAGFTAVAFEGARTAFWYYTKTFNPASLYTGTLTAIIIIVFWFYYAALIFILGGEVGQVYELRTVRHLQRATLSD